MRERMNILVQFLPRINLLTTFSYFCFIQIIHEQSELVATFVTFAYTKIIVISIHTQPICLVGGTLTSAALRGVTSSCACNWRASETSETLTWDFNQDSRYVVYSTCVIYVL